MSRIDNIMDRAKAYLCAGWPGAKGLSSRSGAVPPEAIFDHGRRVFDLSQILMRDATIEQDQVDLEVLGAAALFHDAGWIDLVKTGGASPMEIFCRPADTGLLQRSTQVACDQIGSLLAPRAMDKVVKVITGLKSSRPEFPEAVVLSDADNLDDFGLLGFSVQCRLAQTTGKSIRQVLESWHRQQEYHYWEARIKNALHLQTARAIAQRRLETMGRTFDLLRREMEFEDVREIASSPPAAGGRDGVADRVSQ